MTKYGVFRLISTVFGTAINIGSAGTVINIGPTKLGFETY